MANDYVPYTVSKQLSGLNRSIYDDATPSPAPFYFDSTLLHNKRTALFPLDVLLPNQNFIPQGTTVYFFEDEGKTLLTFTPSDVDTLINGLNAPLVFSVTPSLSHRIFHIIVNPGGWRIGEITNQPTGEMGVYVGAHNQPYQGGLLGPISTAKVDLPANVLGPQTLLNSFLEVRLFATGLTEGAVLYPDPSTRFYYKQGLGPLTILCPPIQQKSFPKSVWAEASIYRSIANQDLVTTHWSSYSAEDQGSNQITQNVAGLDLSLPWSLHYAGDLINDGSQTGTVHSFTVYARKPSPP
jgi:hypothetical protein